MSKVSWISSTEGVVALTSGVPRSALSVAGPSGKTLTVCKFKVDFIGVTAGAAPVLVELMRSTQATTGTSSAVTLRRRRGSASASAGATSAKAFTVEPTVLSLIEDYRVDPYKGLLVIQEPLGREVDDVGGALVLRMTAPADVSCSAFFETEEG